MPFPVGKWSVQRIALGAGLPWDSALRYFWLQRPPLEARSPTHTAWCQWRVQQQKWQSHGIDKMIWISLYKYIYIIYILVDGFTVPSYLGWWSQLTKSLICFRGTTGSTTSPVGTSSPGVSGTAEEEHSDRWCIHVRVSYEILGFE